MLCNQTDAEVGRQEKAGVMIVLVVRVTGLRTNILKSDEGRIRTGVGGKGMSIGVTIGRFQRKPLKSGLSEVTGRKQWTRGIWWGVSSSSPGCILTVISHVTG